MPCHLSLISRVLALSVVLQATACAAAPASTLNPTREALSAEEEVHLMLVERRSGGEWPGITVLADSTAGPGALPDDPTGLSLYLPEGLVPDELVESFVRRNQTRRPISPAVVERLPEDVMMQGEVAARLVEDPTTQDLQLEDGTPVFREFFSAVAVDREGERALVHGSGYCGRRCGGGSSLLLLRRDGDGAWEVERSFRGWTF